MQQTRHTSTWLVSRPRAVQNSRCSRKRSSLKILLANDADGGLLSLAKTRRYLQAASLGRFHVMVPVSHTEEV